MEVLQREMRGQVARPRHRLVGVERGRRDEPDRVEGDKARDDRARCRHHVSASLGRLGAGASRTTGFTPAGSFDDAHASSSSAFVFENAIPEMTATMRKMMIETALASAKSFPLPAAIASLYV